MTTLASAEARRGGFFYVALLGALSALPPLGIDMGLPAIPAMQADLGASHTSASLTLGAFMAGFALTPLLFGALSDRFGRRPVLLIGLALFVVGSLVCLFASSPDGLIAARLLQGAGAGAGPTLALAASRDALQAQALHRRIALLTMLMAIAPVVAPALGVILMQFAGWRGVYGALAGMGTLLFVLSWLLFRETSARDSDARAVSAVSAVSADFDRIARSPQIVGFSAIKALAAAAMFAYVTAAPAIAFDRFQASPLAFAAMFAVTAFAIMLGAGASTVLAHRCSMQAPITAGVCLLLAAPLAELASAVFRVETMISFVACMACATFGFGLVGPAATQRALEPAQSFAGLASAAMNTMQMATMAAASACVAFASPSLGLYAMPAVMIGSALGALMLLNARTR